MSTGHLTTTRPVWHPAGRVPLETTSTLDTNVGTGERLASAVAGGALLLWGISRRSLPGAVAAVLGGSLAYRGITGHCHLYDALGVTSADAEPASHPLNRGITGHASTVINLPVEKVYHFWRDFQHLSAIMPHADRIDVSDGGRRSHWVATLPGDQVIEWDAVLTEDRENERIAWSTVPGSDIPHAGEVHFQPRAGDRQTEVHLTFRYFPPLGAVGAALTRITRLSPEEEAHETLARLKHLLETETFDIPSPATRSRTSFPEDIVDEGSDLSFPASDPPSYMPPGHA